MRVPSKLSCVLFIMLDNSSKNTEISFLLLYHHMDPCLSCISLDPYSPVTVLAVSCDSSLCSSADTTGYIQVFDIQNTKVRPFISRSL